jgi:hypothetical protein
VAFGGLPPDCLFPPTLTPPCSAVPLGTGFGVDCRWYACVILIPAYAFDIVILTLTKTGPIANLAIVWQLDVQM